MVTGKKSNRLRAITLIELVITLVLVSLIVSVAAVSLSAATESGDSEAATSFAKAAVIAQQSSAIRNNGFTPNFVDLGLRAANVHIVDGVATETGQVSMAVGVDGSLAVSAWARDGLCVEAVVESPASVDVEYEIAEGFSCDAAAILGIQAK